MIPVKTNGCEQSPIRGIETVACYPTADIKANGSDARRINLLWNFYSGRRLRLSAIYRELHSDSASGAYEILHSNE